MIRFNRLLSLLAIAIPGIMMAKSLEIAPDRFTTGTLSMPDGETIAYRAYEGLEYVASPIDTVYQTLNIYVPERTIDRQDAAPVFVRTYIGGYMPTQAKGPSAGDATGRALAEGYVLCIPGSRGLSSTVEINGKTVYDGVAPAALLDLKAAIRYLKHNAAAIGADRNRIIIDGTSAGGAMASLVGATGNAPEYESYLRQMGACPETDDVYAAVCYCPITDLAHADMEYEWLYGCTNGKARHIDEAQKQISAELAAQCPAYINSLGLRDSKGRPITADNYIDYLKTFLISSAHRALEEGCDIPDTIGIERYSEAPAFAAGRGAPSFGPGQRMPRFNMSTDYVTGIDLDKYLNYVAYTTPLKTPPAFDAYGVLDAAPTNENKVFADSQGQPANFTDFSLRKRLNDPTAVVSEDMKARVHMYNPMDFIASPSATTAPHWYIRHGAKDRDTSFFVPINLATRLMNEGYDVDFFLPWNRPHSGDYNLDNLFSWLASKL